MEVKRRMTDNWEMYRDQHAPQLKERRRIITGELHAIDMELAMLDKRVRVERQQMGKTGRREPKRSPGRAHAVYVGRGKPSGLSIGGINILKVPRYIDI